MEDSIKMIEKRIEEVKTKRRVYLDAKLGRISKLLEPSYYCDSYAWRTHYYYSFAFVKFLRGLKFSRKDIKSLRQICNNTKHGFSIDNLVKLPQEKWDFVVKLIENTLKHESEFIELKQNKRLGKDKKELCRLTKCYAEKDEDNPCKKICKECGSSNLVEALYCNICGNKFLF